jgi:phospholipase/carboxylesterase
MVLVHGRGASAESMLSLADAFAAPDMAYIAPQAPSGSWYPYSFMAPTMLNEPYLSNALSTLANVVDDLGQQGIPAERIVLLGFSQGACLALEFAARNARRYGGVVGLSGGLIGPEGTPRDYTGALAGTPVFLGCSDVDSHIPLARVHESTNVLRALGGNVTEKIYPGMGHTVVQDEIDHVENILRRIEAPTDR